MGGAIPGKDFLAIMRQAGFADVEMVSETGFNSSAVTQGVLFRAVKPRYSKNGEVSVSDTYPIPIRVPYVPIHIREVSGN